MTNLARPRSTWLPPCFRPFHRKEEQMTRLRFMLLTLAVIARRHESW